MALVPGEYEFTCDECDGDGSLLYARINDDDEPEQAWDKCDDCHGEGTVVMDEHEAADAIEWGGRTPIRTPAAT